MANSSFYSGTGTNPTDVDSITSSKTAAETAATNAATSEANAATSATNAAASATDASNSASSISGSVAAAASSATDSATSAASSSTSATQAATSASNAATSATSASTSAANAATSASSASGSAVDASGSAAAAATSATNASTSASNAATSEANAATSASQAATSASTAQAAASNTDVATVSSNVSYVQTVADNISDVETVSNNVLKINTVADNISEIQAASAVSAQAVSSAADAASSATQAASSATSAATSASTATAAKDAALEALDNFDDRYLGQKASDPTVDNDGDALVAGALYFNTTTDTMKVYEGSIWVAAYASLSGALIAANNLSDVTNVTTARTNLGLGTAATTASTDYATAAQGTLADTSVQPNDSPTFAGLTTTADVSFGDNDKAIFGNGSDLQIYHDGSDSYVEDTAAGELILKSNGPSISFQKGDGTELFTVNTSGASTLSYSGNAKLATTSTGVDITGSDGLTVDAGSSTGTHLEITTTGNGHNFDMVDGGATTRIRNVGGVLRIGADHNNEAADSYIQFDVDNSERMRIDSSGRVGIGTVPAHKLHVADATTPEIIVEDTTNNVKAVLGADNSVGRIGTDTNHPVTFRTNDTERMRIDSSGNVGIGATPPTTSGYTNLTLGASTTGSQMRLYGATSGFFHRIINNNGDLGIQADADNVKASTNITFSTDGSERMRIDSSGNLLVGKTTQDDAATAGITLAANNTIYAARSGASPLLLNRLSSDGGIVSFRKDGTTVGSIGTFADRPYFTGTVGIGLSNDDLRPTSDSGANNDASVDLGHSTVRFRDLYLSGGVIQTDGGKSIFGGTSSVDTSVAVSVQGASNADAMEIKVRTNGKNAIEFRNSTNGTVGKITANASSTTYATTSDYRLKTDVQAVTDATNRLNQLNPVNFEWVSDGTRVDGFLAHEVQSIVPEAITGTKDAMRDEEYEVTPAVLDDDGNVITEAVMGTRSVPDYQGIDQSKLVPLLTAALQEALTEISDLKARVTTLEG